jgi:hypothetical protein
LDLEKLKARNIDLLQVYEVLKNNNVDSAL